MKELIIKVDDDFLRAAKLNGMEKQYMLVRCKDCEYRQDDITHNFCEINSHKCYDDDFCSWAKMKGVDE